MQGPATHFRDLQFLIFDSENIFIGVLPQTSHRKKAQMNDGHLANSDTLKSL